MNFDELVTYFMVQIALRLKRGMTSLEVQAPWGNMTKADMQAVCDALKGGYCKCEALDEISLISRAAIQFYDFEEKMYADAGDVQQAQERRRLQKEGQT